MLDKPFSTKYSAEAAQEALSILNSTNVKDGYALYYGYGNGELLEALAGNSDLKIISIIPDAEKVDELRRQFDSLGFYADRVSVHEGTHFDFHAPPYMASLIIVDYPELIENSREFLEEI